MAKETKAPDGVTKKEQQNIRNPKRPERIAKLREEHGSRIKRKTLKILRDLRSGK